MKIHLATFYSSDLKRSAQRFKYQAEEMGIYDHIHIFSQNDLNLDFKNYVSELQIEILRVKDEIKKKENLKLNAEKFFK